MGKCFYAAWLKMTGCEITNVDIKMGRWNVLYQNYVAMHRVSHLLSLYIANYKFCLPALSAETFCYFYLPLAREDALTQV